VTALLQMGVALCGLGVCLGIQQVSQRMAAFGSPVELGRGMELGLLAPIGVLVPIVLLGRTDAIDAGAATIFVWGGLAIAFWDMTLFRVPRGFSIGFLVAGLGFCGISAPDQFLPALSGSVAAFALLIIAARAFQKRRGIAGMGGGDPLVLAAVVAWTGPFSGLWTLALGAALAALAAMMFSIRRVPFAAMLVLSSWVIVIGSSLLGRAPFWNDGGLF
jgi:prepilin signal peptidase PulO-like enzyme (type II secretory pathway)